MRRKVEPELLDSDCGTPAEITAALADIVRVNRWFGGVDTSECLMRRVVDELALDQIELLDVACGSGDVPLALVRRFGCRGVRLHPTLLDRSAAHLPAVPEAVVGDALDLPFPPCSFDLVSCSLFLHHLEPGAIKRFVQEALRVARIALVINDLRRSWPHWLMVASSRPLFRSRMAWRDGVVSVRRAYTEPELRTLLAGAGKRVEFSRHYLQRIGVIVWK
jgi:SAM-dependent methyltransferase